MRPARPAPPPVPEPKPKPAPVSAPAPTPPPKPKTPTLSEADKWHAAEDKRQAALAERRKREAVLSDVAELRMDDRPFGTDLATSRDTTRKDGWTLAKQRRFLEVFAESGMVSQACDEVRMSRQSAYMFRYHENGRAFAALWDEARTLAGRAVVDDLVHEAVAGQLTQVQEEGVVIRAARRRSANKMVSVIERVRSDAVLGDSRTMAASRDFHTCIHMLHQGRVYANHDHPPLTMPALLPAVRHDFDNPQPSLNYRRWRPEHQAAFCEGLAQGLTIDQTCRAIGRSRSAAYALRNRAEGKAFALAWDAALLVFTHELMDMTLDLARGGTCEEIAKKGKTNLWRRATNADLSMAAIQRLEAIKAREDALYGDGYDRIACPKDFGEALDRLESGAALKAIQAIERGEMKMCITPKRRQ
jgi:hypothetical protein